MSDTTGPSGTRFRAELDDGEVIEADGSTVLDRRSGEQRPAILIRMPAQRAHQLADALDAWSRVVSVFDTRMPAVASELPLARVLDAGAAALGEPAALRAADRVSEGVTAPQRLAAAEVLSQREERLSAVQRVAVVDAAAWWLGEEAGDQLAWALLEAVCSASTTTGQVYVALLGQTEDAAPGTGTADE